MAASRAADSEDSFAALTLSRKLVTSSFARRTLASAAATASDAAVRSAAFATRSTSRASEPRMAASASRMTLSTRADSSLKILVASVAASSALATFCFLNASRRVFLVASSPSSLLYFL